MPGSIFRLLTPSLTTLSFVACDLVRLLVLVSRSRRALAAENLNLRKQLALFQERKVIGGRRRIFSRDNQNPVHPGRDLLAQSEIETTEGKRNRAILAVLLGCALRRSELASLESRHIQQREGRWVFVDLVGKGKRIRTVPIPPFVKVAIEAWMAAAGLSEGPLFRRVRRRKYPEKTPAALSERMIWHIVTKYARQTGIVDKLAPMI